MIERGTPQQAAHSVWIAATYPSTHKTHRHLPLNQRSSNLSKQSNFLVHPAFLFSPLYHILKQQVTAAQPEKKKPTNAGTGGAGWKCRVGGDTRRITPPPSRRPGHGRSKSINWSRAPIKMRIASPFLASFVFVHRRFWGWNHPNLPPPLLLPSQVTCISSHAMFFFFREKPSVAHSHRLQRRWAIAAMCAQTTPPFLRGADSHTA